DENFSVANLTASSVNLDSVEKVVISCKEIYYYQSVVQLSTFYNMDRINLSHNDADVMVSGALKGLTQLEELHLQSNNIGKIDDEALEGLRTPIDS
ncbi:hypothetical protein Anas_12549, partial [Armadillidium nasatum]